MAKPLCEAIASLARIARCRAERVTASPRCPTCSKPQAIVHMPLAPSSPNVMMVCVAPKVVMPAVLVAQPTEISMHAPRYTPHTASSGRKETSGASFGHTCRRSLRSSRKVRATL